MILLLYPTTMPGYNRIVHCTKNKVCRSESGDQNAGCSAKIGSAVMLMSVVTSDTAGVFSDIET